MFESLFNKIGSLFSNEESGIKVVGDHWFARYSNAFKDREDEVFPVKAIDAYIDRLDVGVVPMPELWVWHTPIVLGKAKAVARIGMFVVAAGTFADTPVGRAAKAYLATHKAKLSHGFVFEKETFKDNAYHDFNTFEISILPFGKGVEANAYTNIEVKDMAISKEKEQFFVEMFGADTAKELIDNTDKASKALVELGVEFKDFADISKIKKPTGKAEDDEEKKPPFMHDDEESDDEEEDEDEKAFKALVADNVASIAEIADYQLMLGKAVKAMRADLDAKLATANKQIAALKQDNKALREELKLTPRGTRATESDETETDDEDLEDNLKKKEEGEADDFWKFAKTKK